MIYSGSHFAGMNFKLFFKRNNLYCWASSSHPSPPDTSSSGFWSGWLPLQSQPVSWEESSHAAWILGHNLASVLPTSGTWTRLWEGSLNTTAKCPWKNTMFQSYPYTALEFESWEHWPTWMCSFLLYVVMFTCLRHEYLERSETSLSPMPSWGFKILCAEKSCV